MEYEFVYEAEGKEHTGLSFARGERLPVGAAVTVEYDPDDPATAIIEGMRRSSFTWVYGAVPLTIVVLLGLCLVAMYRHNYRVLMLLRFGQIAEASRRPSAAGLATFNQGSESAGRFSNFEFAVAGSTYPAIWYAPAQARSESQTASVVFDPARPERNVIVDGELAQMLSGKGVRSATSKLLDCAAAPLAVVAIWMLSLMLR